MTFQEAEDAYINHKRVYRNVTDYDKELYIEAITGALCCSVKGNDEIRYYANLSDGTQVSIDQLNTICPGQLEYDLEGDAVSKITFRTKRYGEHTTPKQAQECIDAYEQRIEKLTSQFNLLDECIKKMCESLKDSGEVSSVQWEKINTMIKRMYSKFASLSNPSKELTLNAEQIERCKKIFEDSPKGTKELKNIFKELTKEQVKEHIHEIQETFDEMWKNCKSLRENHIYAFGKGDYVMGEHFTPEGEKAVYIGIINEVHPDNVFFEAIYIIPFNGNKSQLLIGCKAYKKNTILFNNKHKKVITGPHGVYIEQTRLTTMKQATRDKITQLDHNLGMFGFKYDDFEMLNDQWEGE